MPALLPLKDPDTIKLNTSPLLFHFNSAVPMGFFCAVIVHLLSVFWKIFIEEGSFSNFCTLQRQILKGRYLKIALVERLNCIEIYCDEAQHRLKAKTELVNAIDSVMEVLKLSEKPSLVFYCPCKKEGEHVATVDVKERDNSSIDCVLHSSLELSDEKYDDYFSWFFTQRDYPNVSVVDETDGPDSMQCAKVDIVPSLVAVPPTKRVRADEEEVEKLKVQISDKEEQIAKLIKKEVQKDATTHDIRKHKNFILRSLQNIVKEWKTLGDLLGIEKRVLDQIECDHGSANLCRINMISHWLEGGAASLESLIEALEILGRNDIIATLKNKENWQ
ncbi:PREDICTED: uncharacterized protein LOC109591211 [Amphimedon queenslandica]|nr:PREDICTED: uncharacterized protein LOC109591211 [Amphimedon queenslandica]|eukprot:XP_019862545.1 PREDICTED: uncharacterized protein LOC109591211 [Amphimedon queenslandica]